MLIDAPAHANVGAGRVPPPPPPSCRRGDFLWRRRTVPHVCLLHRSVAGGAAGVASRRGAALCWVPGALALPAVGTTLGPTTPKESLHHHTHPHRHPTTNTLAAPHPTLPHPTPPHPSRNPAQALWVAGRVWRAAQAGGLVGGGPEGPRGGAGGWGDAVGAGRLGVGQAVGQPGHLGAGGRRLLQLVMLLGRTTQHNTTQHYALGPRTNKRNSRAAAGSSRAAARRRCRAAPTRTPCRRTPAAALDAPSPPAAAAQPPPSCDTPPALAPLCCIHPPASPCHLAFDSLVSPPPCALIKRNAVAPLPPLPRPFFFYPRCSTLPLFRTPSRLPFRRCC